MSRRGLYILGIVLLLAFAGFAFSSFQESLTPYVSFDQARTTPRALQIAGSLVDGSSQYLSANESLVFTLAEESTGDTMRVRYLGLKPANFEEAVSIVAIGRYSREEGVFVAEKLLVKCPSKYQGLQDEGQVAPHSS